MRNILVIYGGESYEHDISILSAIQIIGYLGNAENKVFPCYITRNGDEFIIPKHTLDARKYTEKRVKGKKLKFSNQSIKVGLKRIPIDCALVVCHGGKGENGALAGMLEMYNIPYSTGSPLALAVCMNKAKTHEKCSNIGVNCVDYVLLHKEKTAKNYDVIMPESNYEKVKQHSNCERDKDIDEVCDIIIGKLGEGLIIKPNNLGSSIGVKCADNFAELREAIMSAAELDNEIIVEKRINNLIEYNCACMRFDGDYLVSEIERPISARKVLDFQSKYMQNGKMSGIDREFPADIDESLREKIMSSTLKAYIGLELKGIVRIDYLYDSVSGDFYLNEVNTVPGSLAYYLFDITPIKLLNMAINESITCFNAEKLYERQYHSEVLAQYGQGSKIVK